MSSVVAIALYTVGVVVALVRLVYVLWQTGKPLKVRGKGDSRPFRTLIVLGSGELNLCLLFFKIVYGNSELFLWILGNSKGDWFDAFRGSHG